MGSGRLDMATSTVLTVLDPCAVQPAHHGLRHRSTIRRYEKG